MINTAVYAYWAKPFVEKNIYSNFERKSDLLVSLKLSVEQARKFFDKVVFYGDHEAISQICKIVKFDEIYDDVEKLNEKKLPSYFYTLPKVVACEKMKEPFVLFENDFYLWDVPEDSSFYKSEVIVEDFKETPDAFHAEINTMKTHGLVTRPRWYRFAKNKNLKVPLKGIYGGNNVKFINEHATEILRLTENEQNMKSFTGERGQREFVNTHRIYDMWYLGAKLELNNIETFSLRDSNVKYTHLYSDKKRDDSTLIKLYTRTKQDLPEFMDSVREKEGVIFDPLSDYDYFIEKTPDIKNIKCGQKKLTFVMALMNRFNQIEKTLIQNLEDNWEDRDDVEFVLMDVNSKDGFRDWIRDQDLTKYTECGYLRYYEVDSLDQWHASICKNTATHQARGTIVVTLDCDNFTGKRGGKFVISKFEQNDHNCVVHQFDGQYHSGTFGRIALTKKTFDEIGGYDQSLLPMGYQDWDIIKRAMAIGCEYVNPADSDYNQAIENEGKKTLSMANQKETHKKMGWTEMNRINKLKCHINLYQKKHTANNGYYGIRSNVRRIL